MAQALQCQVASAKDDFASENENRTWRFSSEDVRARGTYLADEMYYRFLNNKGGEYDQK
ncbi:hypothetical protein [Bartonella taylorii]|uniref:hypothetical protein n=1 Tax=Bartonella taylorii TaxID=33046 RepID=UPI001ABB143E|nr:hypothetical protein [Bartonella taylorii]